MKNTDELLKIAVTEYFGERCQQYDSGCLCCRAWGKLDRIEKVEAENVMLREALEKISCPSQTTDLLWWQEEAREALKGGLQ